MHGRAPKLVVGVGSVLHHDDGLGVRLAEMLHKLPLPPDIEVLDAGTVGLDAAEMMADRNLVVIIDAIDAHDEPGAIYRMKPEELRPLIRSRLSLHDAHLLDALDELRLVERSPNEVVILALEAQDVSFGIGLSPHIESRLERLLELTLQELGLSVGLVARADTHDSAWTQ